MGGQRHENSADDTPKGNQQSFIESFRKRASSPRRDRASHIADYKVDTFDVLVAP
ncbi:hypothetical protein PISMIDRAFT_681793 [Pisolithus microcarpus 441]|uniref:Uncharacterized protein n=1 Tax=Pisolithus microcarpus 441 TaxID=765257 RepID=A0A0C9Z4B3_9AGAM|nr:hypothetical protein PISMIDRAFT_681793 [Pisolithus microcarpus 441]